MFRRSATKQRAELRNIGFEAAVGLLDADAAPPAPPARLGLDCPTCDTKGQIDMIDTAAGRAYLTCKRCGRTWDTDRAALSA